MPNSASFLCGFFCFVFFFLCEVFQPFSFVFIWEGLVSIFLSFFFFFLCCLVLLRQERKEFFLAVSFFVVLFFWGEELTMARLCVCMVLLVVLGVAVEGFEVKENPTFESFSEDVKPFFHKQKLEETKIDHDEFEKMIQFAEEKGLFSPFNPTGGKGAQGFYYDLLFSFLLHPCPPSNLLTSLPSYLPVENCQEECKVPISWDEPQYFCTTSGESFQNFMCPR